MSSICQAITYTNAELSSLLVTVATDQCIACLVANSTSVEASCILHCGAVITRSIFSQIFTKPPHSSPVRARYEVHFVDSASDLYSASVTLIVYVISYNIGPRYNGTWLYMPSHYLHQCWIIIVINHRGHWPMCTLLSSKLHQCRSWEFGLAEFINHVLYGVCFISMYCTDMNAAW